ncbi:MAG: hypothetical protein AAF485_07995 [Chloroflexota bacterium]
MMIGFPILQTKLFIPHLQSEIVSRPRLLTQLQSGLTKKLILVAAPAGFGKTTLVCQLLQQLEAEIAWVTLDAEDNDLVRFLSYLIASLQTLSPHIGKTTLAMLSELDTSSISNVLTPLANDLVTFSRKQDTLEPRDVMVVLDDYHIIQSPKVHDFLAFLLDNLPPFIHFVVTSRSRPPLPLARLRARNQMVDVTERDLRFSEEESQQFFNRLMAPQLSAQMIKALETRTEGWVAGMQMAAISMKSTEDVDRFIRDFSGNDRFITDYLLEEVLNSIPADMQTFLLQTSLLDQLHGPLCDVVTQRSDSQQFLERFETYDEQQHTFTYVAEFEKSIPGIKSARNTWRVDAISDTQTRFTMSSKTEFNLLPGVLMRLPLRFQVPRILKKNLQEAKYYIETGAPHPRKVAAMQKAGQAVSSPSTV